MTSVSYATLNNNDNKIKKENASPEKEEEK